MIRGQRHDRTRALCAALIIWFAAGQIAGVAHATETAHAVCAEHGELIDLPSSRDTASAPSSERCETAKFSDAAASSIAAHQHCAFANAFRHHGLAGRVPPTTGSTVETRSTSMNFVRVPPPPRLALYQLAPKTSPPLAV